jgi:superfamily II DNA or RNA helicase
MDGLTPPKEREALLHLFRGDTAGLTVEAQRWCSILMLSKVGDKGIDLPDANVLIQIATHGKAREQEVQRLGRIGRQKLSDRAQEAGSIFYSLISTHTNDMSNADHRAQYVEELMGIERKEVDAFKLPKHILTSGGAGEASSQEQIVRKCLEKAVSVAFLRDHLTFYRSVALVGQPPVTQAVEEPWQWIVPVQAPGGRGKGEAASREKPRVSQQQARNPLFKKRARECGGS